MGRPGRRRAGRSKPPLRPPPRSCGRCARTRTSLPRSSVRRCQSFACLLLCDLRDRDLRLVRGRTPKPVKDTSSPGFCQAGSGLTSRRRDRGSRRSPSVGANAPAVSSSRANPSKVAGQCGMPELGPFHGLLGVRLSALTRHALSADGAAARSRWTGRKQCNGSASLVARNLAQVLPGDRPGPVARAGRAGDHAVQAARRCSSQIVTPSAAAVSATKMPASMNWKCQNRLAGW
jgi:hypothetical protein